MKHLKTFENIINSMPGIGKSEIMKNAAKRLGYEVIELKMNVTIWELDSKDKSTRRCTGQSLDMNEEEYDLLRDKNLIVKGFDGYHYYIKDDKEEIENILNINRELKKYNL